MIRYGYAIASQKSTLLTKWELFPAADSDLATLIKCYSMTVIGICQYLP